MNISLSGTNVFQTGANVTDYALDANDGVRLVAGYDQPGSEVFTTALDALLAGSYADPFRRNYATRLRNAIDSGTAFKAILDAAPTLNTTFSATPLSRGLRRSRR